MLEVIAYEYRRNGDVRKVVPKVLENQYVEKGYTVIYRHDSFSTVVFRNEVLFTLCEDNHRDTIVRDAHDIICQYYGLKKINEKRAEDFFEACLTGKIELDLDNNDNLIIAS